MIRKYIFTFVLVAVLLVVNFCNAQMKITVLDVGQGDSVLIQTDTENILVDTGDFTARNALLQHLGNLNINYLNKLILTHPHADHIANAAYLISEFGVAAVFDNGRTSANKFYRNYLTACKDSNVPRYTLRDGDCFFLDDGAFIEVLSSNHSAKNQNNDSVVFKLVYGNFKMLFTGDAEADIETELIASADDISADILKAAHHGSKSSNTLDFIKNVSPNYIIISAGRNNKFNHPNKAALDNFIIAGVPPNNIFCTAFNGNISITTDGSEFSVAPQFNNAWLDNYLGYHLTISNIDF